MIIAEDRIEVVGENRAALQARFMNDYVPAAEKRGLQLVDASISPPFDLVDQPGLLRLRWQIADVAAWWAMRAASNDPAVPAFWTSVSALMGWRERRYWVAEPLTGGARVPEASWPAPARTSAYAIETRGWRETAQLHLAPGSANSVLEALRTELTEAGRALPGIEAAFLAANHVADYGAGHFTWDLLFPDRATAMAARQNTHWRDRIMPALARHCRSWTALGLETIGAGLRRGDLEEGVKRTALFRELPNVAQGKRERFERDLLEMPAHVTAILNWRLSRAIRLDWSDPNSPEWSHVWEQEYDRLEGLTVDYMIHPHHWAHVDRWFDPESGSQIIDTALCHAFSPLSGTILGRDARR